MSPRWHLTSSLNNKLVASITSHLVSEQQMATTESNMEPSRPHLRKASTEFKRQAFFALTCTTCSVLQRFQDAVVQDAGDEECLDEPSCVLRKFCKACDTTHDAEVYCSTECTWSHTSFRLLHVSHVSTQRRCWKSCEILKSPEILAEIL